MRRDTRAERLVERIYDTVEDDDAWSEVVAEIVELIGGENGIVSGVPKTGSKIPFAKLHRLDPDSMQKYSQRHLQNPWSRWMVSHPVGVPIASDALVPLRELKASEFFADIVAPQHSEHGALFRLHDAPTFHTALSIHRSAKHGPFSPAELAVSLPFMPHLRRAAQLRLLLEDRERERRLAVDALDRLATGVLFVGDDGRVLFANRLARELATARDAIVLDDRIIRARHRQQDRALQSLIGSALAGGAGGVVALPRTSGGLPLAALVTPLVGTVAVAAAAVSKLASGTAAVFLSDPERQAEPPPERLRGLYGFTPTETRVALELVKAGSIPRAALALRLSTETVRSHLKRIYVKTGVNQQSALVRLLTAAAAVLPP
jgi:DNA-binding CsgD family transcriptional regulator